MNAKQAAKALERAAAVEAMVGHILDAAAGTPSGFVHVTPCDVNDGAIEALKACHLLSPYGLNSAYGWCQMPSHYYQVRKDLPEEWDKEQRANLKATCEQKTRAAVIAFVEAAHGAGLKIENRPADPGIIKPTEKRFPANWLAMLMVGSVAVLYGSLGLMLAGIILSVFLAGATWLALLMGMAAVAAYAICVTMLIECWKHWPS